MVKIFHFHNGTGGGVLSVIRSLLAYSSNVEIENHVIYTINKEQFNSFEIPGLKGAVSEKVFYYSPKWNFYYTCKQLYKFLPNDKAVIVAHDWLELGMVSNLGLFNPVVCFVHGNYQYYYDLCLKHYKFVNCFIAVSSVIKDKLVDILPQGNFKVTHCKFPVPDFNYAINFNANLSCAYYVSFLNDPNKKFDLLPLIDAGLKSYGIKINWHIAGSGYTRNELLSFWPDSDFERIHFYGKLKNDDLPLMLSSCHIMILPSINEGFPVSVIEGMKMGLIPLVNDWGKTTDELIISGFTGFKIEGNLVKKYVEIIKSLYLKEYDLEILSISAKNKANELFNPIKNTDNIISLIISVIDLNENRKPQKVYGSRLDNIKIPNVITYIFRKLK